MTTRFVSRCEAIEFHAVITATPSLPASLNGKCPKCGKKIVTWKQFDDNGEPRVACRADDVEKAISSQGYWPWPVPEPR